MDNAFFTFLSKACDVLFLSFIWVVACIPIVTIGPANTALYYATVKVIRRDRGYLFREFFKSFKLNFKRAFAVGVLLTVLFVILGIDIRWARQNISDGGAFISILYGIFIAIIFLLISVTIYVFPILSRFDMTVKQLLKAAVFISMRHLPSTIAMLVITAIGALGIYIIPIAVLVIPAAVVLLNSFFMERILKKYMPKAEEASDEEHPVKDEWYLE